VAQEAGEFWVAVANAGAAANVDVVASADAEVAQKPWLRRC